MKGSQGINEDNKTFVASEVTSERYFIVMSFLACANEVT